MRTFGIALMLILMAWQVQAAETGALAGLVDRTDALRAALPERRLREIKDTPERFIEEMATLIYGYGQNGRIDAAGLARMIAFDRAHVRAREIRRFLEADLDDDGAVTEDEISTMIEAEAASARGRLVVAFRKADANRDARVTPDEMRAHATKTALKEVSAKDAAALEALLLMDEDGDGGVSLDEAVFWIEALGGNA